MSNPYWLARGKHLAHLLPRFANRHGLVTGATGTGKTVTLQILAEGFSAQRRAGVPGRCQGRPRRFEPAHRPHPKIDERLQKIGIEGFSPAAWPVVFWDLFGERPPGPHHHLGDGPAAARRLLELNDTQEGVLNIAFRSPTNRACCCSI
jgi:uncharacterized protein